MGSTRYITSMGELSRKDNSLCFRKDGKNVYIPIENTKLLDFLARNDIVVHFFNYFEGYSGTFYPRNKYNSGKLLVKQVEKYENSEERLKIAKSIVKGIGVNISEILYHYYRHEKFEVKEVIDWIRKDAFKQIENAKGIQQVMAVEGEIWQRFYSTFKYFLPEDFIMNKRVKRPPDNPINSYLYFMMLEKNVCKRFLKFVKNTYHIFKNRYLEGR